MIIQNAAHLLERLPALKLYAAFNTSNKKQNKTDTKQTNEQARGYKT